MSKAKSGTSVQAFRSFPHFAARLRAAAHR